MRRIMFWKNAGVIDGESTPAPPLEDIIFLYTTAPSFYTAGSGSMNASAAFDNYGYPSGKGHYCTSTLAGGSSPSYHGWTISGTWETFGVPAGASVVSAELVSYRSNFFNRQSMGPATVYLKRGSVLLRKFGAGWEPLLTLRTLSATEMVPDSGWVTKTGDGVQLIQESYQASNTQIRLQHQDETVATGMGWAAGKSEWKNDAWYLILTLDDTRKVYLTVTMGDLTQEI